jgi:hypothetical protein
MIKDAHESATQLLSNTDCSIRSTDGWVSIKAQATRRRIQDIPSSVQSHVAVVEQNDKKYIFLLLGKDPKCIAT